MQYRKRPVCIEAIEWNGSNLREVIDFTGLHPSAEKWTWEEYEQVVAKDGLKIFTLEGLHLASVGDMIIRGVKGEFYPCKPDIFAETYETVGQDSESPEPANNTQKQSASQIAADMAEWAEHLDQYSNESTYCRINLWKRQLQLL